MLTVDASTGPYGKRIYSGSTHTFNEGLTILVGPNGSGKTTLLSYIEEFCKREKIPVFSYNNYNEGGQFAMDHYLNVLGDTKSLATCACSSEGQRIYYNFGETVKKLKPFINKNLKKGEPMVFCFDALDSGLDIGNIQEFINLFNLVIKDVKNLGGEPYILVSANSYGLVEGNTCYDVVGNKEKTFKSYGEYKKFILSRIKH